MAHAETCPVCEGRGTIPNYSGTNTGEKTCHGCNGLGWVTVEDSEKNERPE